MMNKGGCVYMCVDDFKFENCDIVQKGPMSNWA